MLRNGRPEVPHFDRAELLYLRYGANDFREDGNLDPAALRCPGQSVNRGNFSSPEDVLFHETGKFNGLGVVEFRVQDIPETVSPEQGPGWRFFARHVPEESNYAHSEIGAALLSGTERSTSPSKSVKLKFRIHLSRLIREDRIQIRAARNRF